MQVSLWERNELCSWMMTTTSVSGVFVSFVEWELHLNEMCGMTNMNARFPTFVERKCHQP